MVPIKYRTVVFVHGCFWHRHPGCREAAVPKTRTAFWEEKFARNVSRDRRVQRVLRKLGWRVVVVCECQVLRDPVLAWIRRRLVAGLSRGR